MDKYIEKKDLKKAKDGDDGAILDLIETFKGTVNSLSYKYSINGYESEDLIQESNIAILNALKKINPEDDKKDINNYLITSVTNNFYNLIKSKSKYNNEINLTTFSNEDSDFINSVPDDYSLENDFINSITVASLHYALSNLPAEELDLAKCIYFDNMPLTEYCKEKGISYKVGRTKIKKLLSTLRDYIL